MENNFTDNITQFLESDKPKELLNFLSTEEENEIFNFRMGETGLTILDKVVLNNNNESFDQVLLKLSKKFTSSRLRDYINSPDREGNTSLLYAAYRGNYYMIDQLISKGANILAKSRQGLNVMHMAAQGDNPNIIVYFKDRYDINIYSVDNNGNTPLHWACYTCSENAVNFLLSYMDEINMQDKQGQTPLHIAIFTERVKIIKKLLHKGANIMIRDKKGKTAVDLAIELTGSSSKITSILISRKYIKTCVYGEDESEINHSNSLVFNMKTSAVVTLLYILTIGVFQLTYLPRYYTGIFLVLTFLITILFIFANLSNPGYLINKNKKDWLALVEENINIKLMCPYCMVKKGKMSKHCFLCGNCISEFDHHCNLLGNCIGKENRGVYLLLLLTFLVFVGFSYTIGMKVFLINEKSTNESSLLLPFYFIYKKNVKDTVSVLTMTLSIFFFCFGAFLVFKQLRQIVIIKKIKSI